MRPTWRLCRRAIVEAIERHTRVNRDHLTPELGLRLLAPDLPMYAASEEEACKTFGELPFWAVYWPGGQALTRWILDEKTPVRGKRVLDIGAGCGASAIAAVMVGAVDAVANDIDPVACAAAESNARLNDVRIRTCSANLLVAAAAQPNEPFDVVLVGDLLYDEATAGLLLTWLDSLEEASEIYLADPGRHGLTPELRSRLEHLATYELPVNARQENYGFSEASVWRFFSKRRSCERSRR